MSNMAFGGFAAVAGIGITLLVLYILGWIIRLMLKLFPVTEEEKETKK
jgi:Na+-transporting methylmalonyl-CoA/oxaloacetate decarboxylase gamma subunit